MNMDVADAPPPATSLMGTWPCGGAMCATGEICMLPVSRSDAGTGAGSAYCVAAPTPCTDLRDCGQMSCGNGRCPNRCPYEASACVARICGGPRMFADVNGRNVFCSKF